ncbi:unnamed protein product [Adineta ricciae]|uniref:Secreted protein n=1 Tax=Adineta ricciae TaxID=249248 RepID=A0A815JIJ2_ADIRI|nr:unnamed protein product [Adineta ricciae]
MTFILIFVTIFNWIWILESVTAPNLIDFQLRSSPNHAELLNCVGKLNEKLAKLGVKNILLQANRQGTKSTNAKTCNPNATLKRNLTSVSYCFNPSDSSTIGGNVEWMPQGVTTVADARSTQLWNTKRAILITWYDKKSEKPTNTDADQIKGARVTFFDPETSKYQHVLLVYPYLNNKGEITYMSLRTIQKDGYDSLHAGGIVWYDNYLYVADTARGFRIFDMRQIFDLSQTTNGNTNDKHLIGFQNGKFYAHGYRYIMPQINDWSNIIPRNSSMTCRVNAGSPTFSFVSLDRTDSDHLISGEFCADKTANGDLEKSGRVARWPLDKQTGQPKLTNGIWKADSAYRLPISNIQGAVSFENKWYLSRSQGAKNGFLYKTKSINSTTGILQIENSYYSSVGPEDLSHWPTIDGKAGGLWTVSEHAGKRLLYVCNIDQLNNSNQFGNICGERNSFF